MEIKNVKSKECNVNVMVRVGALKRNEPFPKIERDCKCNVNVNVN